MPIGRASCKECGTLVEHEVEKDVECTECGRVFQIPNSREYLTNPLRNHSLSRISSEVGLDIRPINTEGDGRNSWQYHGTTRTRQIVSVVVFPKRDEAEVFQENDRVEVVAEYPGHDDINQISASVVGETLLLKSRLRFCSYTDTIENLGIFVTIFERHLNNGILVVKLKA